MDQETDFYVNLSSDTKTDFKNSKALFKIKLPITFKLKTGHWKVALTQISYPFNWNNMDASTKISIIHKIGAGYENFEPIIDDAQINLIKSYLNDKPKLTPNDMSHWIKTTYSLDVGYYPNVESIAESILKKFKLKTSDTANKNLPIEYVSNNDGDAVSFNGPRAYIFLKSAKWDSALFLDGTHENGDYRISVGAVGATAVLDVINSIYVYSSIVEHNIVGSSEIPLLTIVPVEGKHGTQVTYTPLRPEYKSVAQEYINDIEMQLARSNGKDIPFLTGGVVRVTLHFKRIGIEL